MMRKLSRPGHARRAPKKIEKPVAETADDRQITRHEMLVVAVAAATGLAIAFLTIWFAIQLEKFVYREPLEGLTQNRESTSTPIVNGILWQTYRSSRDGYEIKYPPDWTATASAGKVYLTSEKHFLPIAGGLSLAPGQSLFLIGRLGPRGSPLSREPANPYARPLERWLQEYFNGSPPSRSKSFILVGGYPALEIVPTAEGGDVVTVFVSKSTDVFELTYTVSTPEGRLFNEKILRSFTFNTSLNPSRPGGAAPSEQTVSAPAGVSFNKAAGELSWQKVAVAAFYRIFAVHAGIPTAIAETADTSYVLPANYSAGACFSVAAVDARDTTNALSSPLCLPR